MERYWSSYSPSEIMELLQHANPSFILISKCELSGNSLKLHSREIPEGVIHCSLKPLPEAGHYKTEISVKVDSMDYEKSASMLLYVFGYLLIAIVFILLVIRNPANPWLYVMTGIACFLLPPLIRLYHFFEYTPPVAERAKEEFLERIKAVKAG